MGRHQHLCKWSDTSLNELVDLYQNGQSYSQLADRFNCSLATISRTIKRSNIEPRINRCTLNTDYFKSLDTHEKCYWFGFLCADGHVSRLKTTINLKYSDENHLIKFRNCIESTHKISERKSNNTFGNFKHMRLDISSKRFCDMLRSHGVVEIKNDNISSLNNIVFVNSWIAGFWDGDGWIYYKRTPQRHKTVCGIVGTINVLKFIRETLFNNCEANKDIKIVKQPGIYKMQYGGSRQVLKILNWIYKDTSIYLDRKYAIYQKLRESIL